MASINKNFSEKEIAQRIKAILEAIKSPEHADDIIELRRSFRKQVPFFFRSYFAAYLLKDFLQQGQRDEPSSRQRGKPEARGRDSERSKDEVRRAKADEPRKPKKEDRRPQAETNRDGVQGVKSGSQEERKTERRPALPEGVETVTLFVSAGRKRHFYPRHFLEIFSEAGIAKESVGEIRLFDNYTFVQILASEAQEAIEKLDGISFKGRKLSVSFARKKEESSSAYDSAFPTSSPAKPELVETYNDDHSAGYDSADLDDSEDLDASDYDSPDFSGDSLAEEDAEEGEDKDIVKDPGQE